MSKRVSKRAIKAAETGDIEGLRKQLESGKSEAGAELLQWWAAHLEVVQLLLEHGADPDEKVYHETFVANSFRKLAEICADDGDDSLADLLKGKSGPQMFINPQLQESDDDSRWASDLIHAAGNEDENLFQSWNGQAHARLFREDGKGLLVVLDMAREGDEFGPSDVATIAWKHSPKGIHICASASLADHAVAQALGVSWPDRERFVELHDVQGWGE